MEDKVHALLEQTVSDDETKATTAEASHQAYTWVVDIYNLWMYVDHTRKFPYIVYWKTSIIPSLCNYQSIEVNSVSYYV